mgnify:CR=1 FL=1
MTRWRAFLLRIDHLFVGNETFPEDSLKRAIATRETECRSALLRVFPPLCPLGVGFALSRSQLRERDLPRDRARLILYYRQRGFRDVQVDSPTVVRTPTHAEVTFRVSEGRPVLARTIAYEGVDSLNGDLLADLPIREGDRLSVLALDATRDTIVERLSAVRGIGTSRAAEIEQAIKALSQE